MQSEMDRHLAAVETYLRLSMALLIRYRAGDGLHYHRLRSNMIRDLGVLGQDFVSRLELTILGKSGTVPLYQFKPPKKVLKDTTNTPSHG